MRICDHLSEDPPWLHFEPPRLVSVLGPPRLYLKPLKLLNFDFDKDPDPAFHSDTDTDLAAKTILDPYPDTQPCSERQKNPQKREKNGENFVVVELDGLSRRLKTFLEARPSFIEALEEIKYIAIFYPKM
jgi:hypothetical protein